MPGSGREETHSRAARSGWYSQRARDVQGDFRHRHQGDVLWLGECDCWLSHEISVADERHRFWVVAPLAMTLTTWQRDEIQIADLPKFVIQDMISRHLDLYL